MATPKKSKSKHEPAGSKTKSAARKGPIEITFHYIKSGQHISIHVDGVVGSLSPHGGVSANFFCERFPIPVEVTHRIDEQGAVQESPTDRKGKSGIVREVLVSATMNAQTAERIGNWLIARAQEAQKVRKND